MVYYEKYGESYADNVYTSKTFDSVHANYVKEPTKNCLVAKPSLISNAFDIMDYDCNQPAYSICQLFADPNTALTSTPPLPPIPTFFQKTELPNFNCYLPSTVSKRKKRENSIEQNQEDTMSSATNSTEKLVLLLDPKKEEERTEKAETVKRQFRSDFGGLDLSISYPYFFELLWYSQLPCSDVRNLTSGYIDEKSFLKRCYWDQEEVECHSIFQMRPTDRGMCCSFNSDNLAKTLREGNFSKVINKLQSQDNQLAFSFKQSSQQNGVENDVDIYGKPGQGKGLMVILDAHTDSVSSGTIFDGFKGFSTVVDGTDQFPLTFQKSFLIQPGYENSVALSAVNIKADDEIRSIPSNKRGCYFSNENSLKLHKQYSYSNCILECSLDYTIDTLSKTNDSNGGCTPWFYPVREIKFGFCDPWQTKNFLSIMADIPTDLCLHCLPDCDTTMYDSSVSTAPIRFCDHTNLGVSKLCTMDVSMNPSLLSESIKKEFWKDKKGTMPEYVEPTIDKLPSTRLFVTSDVKKQNLVFKTNFEKQQDYNAFEQDISIVNFYFEQAFVQCYKRQPSLNIQDFIAGVGGLFGLAVGMSLISMFEIIWHFALLPLINIFKKSF